MVNVYDHEAAGQYEALDQNGAMLGLVQYRRVDGGLALTHTETAVGHEGEGVASSLVRTILDQARRNDTAVLPYCPFVRSYIARHLDYLPLVPADQRAMFSLPADAAAETSGS